MNAPSATEQDYWDEVYGKETPTGETAPSVEAAPEDDLTERRRGEFTHADQAAVLARDLLAGRYKFTKGLGWLRWDGRRWRGCPVEVVRDEIAEHYRRFIDAEHTRVLADAGGGWAGVSKADQAYLASLNRLLAKPWLDAVTSLASGKVLVEADDFDAHPDLLNAANGVVNLATGDLAPHDPALLMRKITPIAYRPDALADPGLARVLECLPDTEVLSWTQVRLGQAATGYVPPDDLLVLFQGGGANGKSTLMGGVMKALGEYAATVDDKVLLDDSSSHSTERMELFGARLGLTEEVPGGRKLDMNKIKKIVGTPLMQARRMRCDPVTWQPTHALFITTNSQPIVGDTDHGAWRRLAKLTFPLRYRPEGEPLEGIDDRRGDTGLRARMETGDPDLLEAVLAWLVDGSRRWYAGGRAMPPIPRRVREDTRAWRAETDLILSFIDDRLVLGAESCVLSTDLYDEFTSWMEAQGINAWSAKTFKPRLLEHPTAQAAKVTAARSKTYDDLDRPAKKARMGWPVGQQNVVRNVRFRRDDEHEDDDHTAAETPNQQALPEADEM
ncbi:DNA primase family protein [Blastococcus tunisiensis]|uniref:Putative DNA primase/helicase n=1 Tax=Blastococcus tunisiensis TaxID=1798228 RepID=A0A1I2G5B0_9ACTN|nr:phage/plasmid primase, P4 family [Blastococcus sp. DSM 46838]SFF11821.1 putative DNA primase/helicase [Blastococcus sp. DSM 46838]